MWLISMGAHLGTSMALCFWQMEVAAVLIQAITLRNGFQRVIAKLGVKVLTVLFSTALSTLFPMLDEALAHLWMI